MRLYDILGDHMTQYAPLPMMEDRNGDIYRRYLSQTSQRKRRKLARQTTKRK